MAPPLVSNMANSWSRLLTITATAVGAACLLHYLLSDNPIFASATSAPSRNRAQDMTKAECIELLKGIVKSQEETKIVMKKLTSDLINNPLRLEQVYTKASQMQPEDPMEQWGVTVIDLDHLIEKYQHDPIVKDYILKIMNSPGINDTTLSDDVRNITISQILAIHEYMLSELESVVREFKSLQNRQTMEIKTLTIAAQAIVAAKVEEKFNLTSDQVESAVIINHAELTASHAFTRLTMQMQTEMSELIG